MNNYCKNCGEKLQENQDVCLKCGSLLKENVNTINDETNNKNSVIGFVLGLVSIIAWILPLVGYPVCICGIVFSAKGLKQANYKGKAIAGLTLSIIFLIITFINSLLGAIIAALSI